MSSSPSVGRAGLPDERKTSPAIQLSIFHGGRVSGQTAGARGRGYVGQRMINLRRRHANGTCGDIGRARARVGDARMTSARVRCFVV